MPGYFATPVDEMGRMTDMKKAPALLAMALAAIAMPTMAERPSYDGEAQIAYLIDMSSGAVLFERNAQRRIPPASMAKMMTAHVRLDRMSDGHLHSLIDNGYWKHCLSRMEELYSEMDE